MSMKLIPKLALLLGRLGHVVVVVFSLADVVVGALLVLAFFLTDGPYSPLYLLGIIPLVTGLLGTCPIYSLIGVNTCPMKK